MEKIKKQIQQKMTDQQRIEFAKQIETLYEAAHANRRQIFGFAVLKGVGTGLGIFLGGTIIVALLLWILSLGSHIPFVGNISQAAESSINQTKEKSPQSNE
jgi:hypothetical protein